MMKRDMDLIRELLLKLESVPSEMGDVFSFSPEDKEVSVEGYTPAQIEYHLSLLREIGFIECPGSQPMLGITFSGLTWAGHDYIGAVRNPDIWRKTKQGAEAAGGFTTDILRDLAKGFIKTQIKRHTGVDL
jgi:Hypothetical protein (DUF2513)